MSAEKSCSKETKLNERNTLLLWNNINFHRVQCNCFVEANTIKQKNFLIYWLASYKIKSSNVRMKREKNILCNLMSSLRNLITYFQSDILCLHICLQIYQIEFYSFEFFSVFFQFFFHVECMIRVFPWNVSLNLIFHIIKKNPFFLLNFNFFFLCLILLI